MMNSHTDIKDKIKNYTFLYDHEKEWSVLEKKLKQKKRKRFIFYFLGTAFLILMSFALYTTLNNPHETGQQKIQTLDVAFTNTSKTNDIDDSKWVEPNYKNENIDVISGPNNPAISKNKSLDDLTNVGQGFYNNGMDFPTQQMRNGDLFIINTNKNIEEADVQNNTNTSIAVETSEKAESESIVKNPLLFIPIIETKSPEMVNYVSGIIPLSVQSKCIKGFDVYFSYGLGSGKTDFSSFGEQKNDYAQLRNQTEKTIRAQLFEVGGKINFKHRFFGKLSLRHMIQEDKMVRNETIQLNREIEGLEEIYYYHGGITENYGKIQENILRNVNQKFYNIYSVSQIGMGLGYSAKLKNRWKYEGELSLAYSVLQKNQGYIAGIDGQKVSLNSLEITTNSPLWYGLQGNVSY